MSDKSINELKDDENDFQTNLNIILQEYKNKQNDFNKRNPNDIELGIHTYDTNKKLEKLTNNNNKIPIIYKAYTKREKPITPITPKITPKITSITPITSKITPIKTISKISSLITPTTIDFSTAGTAGTIEKKNSF